MRLHFVLLAVPLMFPIAGSSQPAETAKQGQPLAVVAGQSLYDDDLQPGVQAQIYQLKQREYELRSKGLENAVNQRLLDAEAKKKGVPSEQYLRDEVDAKVAEPTEAEVRALWIVQKEQLGKPFEELRPQLQRLLKQAKVQEARDNFYKKLRDEAGVKILLQKPDLGITPDLARLRGNPKAPLTIIEFADFQCPYCYQVEPTLKKLLAKYDGKVNISYRDLPLREIHPQAQVAAEASRCALEQGKFWEFHDRLLNDQAKLNQPDLIEHAKALNLDSKQFESCLSSGKYKDQIDRDLQMGLRAGMTGTPGFYINGQMLNGNMPQESFEKVIDAELGAAAHKQNTP